MFQDLFLQVRGIRKGDKAFSEEVLKSWERDLLEMDEILRDRLFLLCIAAEEGWQTAAEVAFRKKGNMADKDLAKVLDRKEKRKREGLKERPRK